MPESDRHTDGHPPGPDELEGPVRMTLNMVVDTAHGAQFAALHRQAAAYAATAPGFLRQDITRHEIPAEDAIEFVVTSDWLSRSAFRAFETSPGQDEATAPLAALRRRAVMNLTDLSRPSTAAVEGEDR